MKTSGDRFEYFKRDGLWYWHLEGAHHPVGPIQKARKGTGQRPPCFTQANGAVGEPIEREVAPYQHA
jgi:hypothetical protein